MEEEGKALTLREASPSRPPSGIQQGVAMVPSWCQILSVREGCLLRKAQISRLSEILKYSEILKQQARG